MVSRPDSIASCCTGAVTPWLLVIAFALLPMGCRNSNAKCNPQMTVQMPVISRERELPVAAVYVNHMYGFRQPSASVVPDVCVVWAVWRDGRVILSGDSLEGGEPYYEGRIDPALVEATIDRLNAIGVFRDADLAEAHWGPDAGFTVIAILDGDRCLEMSSWHELFEANPKLVDTAHGVESLDSRSREQVMNQQPESYRKYRAAWANIRNELGRLTPATRTSAGPLSFTPSRTR